MTQSEAVQLLRQIAKRGFLSAPVPYWLDKNETEQVVSWEPEEMAQMREFLADNQWLAGVGRHPIPSLFGESEQRTISLLGRIVYSMGKHINPEYVSALAQELSEVPANKLSEVSELKRLFDK